MASMAISGADASSATQTIAASAPVAAQSQPATKAPAVLKPDSVKLSAAGQARSMYQQGQTVALIANTLGTDVASVDSYLNITVAVAATPVSAAHAAPAAAQAPVATKDAAAPTAQAPATAQAVNTAPAATTGVAMAALKG
jgi:hypothetical protein